MKRINDQTLLDMLDKDYIERNSQLESIVKLINSIDTDISPVIAIDSPWGSGKTVFMKQLELIYKDTDSQIQAINGTVSQTLRDKNNLYYFNAWENDYFDDPLQAILLNLINDLDTQGLQAKAMKRALKSIDVAAFLKNITKDGVDVSKALGADDSIKGISEVLDRKNRIKKLLQAYIKDTGKRLVFIVDELDRCKPSYAVNLLEVMKHYFTDENVIFIVSVDASQLVHTIKKHYGVGFDGAAYLNRFFDYNLSLTEPDRSAYLKNYLGIVDDSYWVRQVPKAIVEHLDMSMRETETYFNALELLSGYMGQTNRLHYDKKASIFVQYIFTPLALALRIKQPDNLQNLIRGRNAHILKELVLSSYYIQDILKNHITEVQDINPQAIADYSEKIYNDLFATNTNNYETKDLRKEALEVISLVSQYSTIKMSNEGQQND